MAVQHYLPTALSLQMRRLASEVKQRLSVGGESYIDRSFHIRAAVDAVWG